MYNLPNFVHQHFDKTAEELGETEKRVLKKAHERKIVSTDINAAFSANASYGERLADGIARVGGSWAFIVCFLLFLVFWCVVNTIVLLTRAFDPYPFIFLNLVLSMIAAIQAPIIMMSQNRQTERDRFEAAKDYEVNLKAELEVLSLHQKIDMQVLTELSALREEFSSLRKRIEEKSSGVSNN
ncbi:MULTISPECIES: DUF1003 domain-containing protein [Rhizobium]|jgi:uncharacterized membrane protein|uniref:DUF1003 domain-containing protein n=1 Tax=Rhizobium TaxID=379 RepID=UPI0005666447|nr:DUF1003 domain-containing protein [Rhizobium lusitanum]NTJ07316.1 DUF1003 domain-containing protein [Rhizobium lusitanum]